mmetsp:Transcript_22863/g.17324  ORF Transcript_22863/g.17324 Transcript_22863/m.17324 type:complete len:97 (+) Transcript_22863:132-422(+)
MTNYCSTIGSDFKMRSIKIGDQEVKQQIWDTAGQERFRTLTAMYYRGANGIVLAYAINDKTSFESLKNWISEVERHRNCKPVFLLVGNKADLSEQR